MAYNFELSFTQPLLADLDNGLLSDADDWANAITKYYIRTIKGGFPQGVPPTAPAPGLNPLAPPPFPISVAPFTTTNARQRIMYETIRAYFTAKDIELNKGAVEGLASTIKQLITKARTTKRQIQTLSDEIKLVQRELKEIPQLLKDIQDGVKILIDRQKEKLQELFSIIENFKLDIDLTDEEVQAIFADELVFINSIKNADITSFDSIKELKRSYDSLRFSLGATVQTEALSNNPQDLERGRQGAFSQQAIQAQRQQLLKKYLKTRIFELITAAVDFADILLEPTKFLDLANELAAADRRLVRLAKAVGRLGVIERYVKPQIKKLELQLKAKKKQIQDYINPKIKELKQKFSDKVAELAKRKKESKKSELYVKALQRVKDFREKNQERVTKIKKNVKVGSSLLKQSYELLSKVDALKDGILFEIEDFKKDIEALQAASQNLQDIRSNNKDFKDTYEKPNLEVQRDATSIEAYLVESGLDEFAQQFTLLAVQLKCNLVDFKTVFDKNVAKYKRYQEEIESLSSDIDELYETAQQLDTNQQKPKLGKVRRFVGKGVISLKKLLQRVIQFLRPKIMKVVQYIRLKVDSLKKSIPKILKKFKNDIEVFLINLVPLRSDAQDAKDKPAELDAKKKRIEEKKKKLQKALEQSRYIIRASKGVIDLSKNIAGGRYFLNDNAQPVDSIAEGIYGYRGIDQSPSIKRQLLKEKQEFKDEFKKLAFIESLIKASLLSFENIKQTNFIQEFEEFIDQQLGLQTQQFSQAYTQLLNFFKNPPKTPQELVDSVNQLTYASLEDISLINKLVQLEKKYLSKTVEVFKTIATAKSLEKYPKVRGQFAEWQKSLSRHDSFILYIIKKLSKAIKEFVLFIGKNVNAVIKPIKVAIKRKIKKIKEQNEAELKTIKDKLVNVDAIAMSVTFGLAARLFWTGAQWTGPTGTSHVVFSIGSFKRIKAKPTEGASAMIRQMASSFEQQLKVMSGLAIPPPNTGIPPLPFKGYI